MTPSLISSEHGNRPSDPAAYGNESQGHNYAANAAPSNDANQSGQPSQDTLISWAKRVVAHDMGLKDESLLDDKFYFIGPFDGPVGKRAFIDGSKTFDLRGAFPDFDFQAHDFRVDEVERSRVWFTTRKKGTHKGDLPMYGKIIKATNRTLDFPPEGYSVTFNPAGRVTKLTGGFVMDATQGNSSGLGGPLGIAAAVGHPQPAYTHQPPATAIKSCCLPIGDNVQEWIHNNFPSVAPSPHPRPSNPPHAPGTGARAGSAPQSQPPPQQQQARGQQYTADTTHPPVAQPITNDGQYLSQPPPPPQNQGKDAHPPPQPQQPQQPPNPPSGQPPAQSHPFLGGIFDQIFDFSTLTGLTGMLGGGNRQEQQRPTHYAQVTGDEHPPLDTSQSQGKDAHGRPIFAQIADPNSAPAPAHVETPQDARVGDHGNEGGKEDMGQRLPDSERAVSPEQVQQEAQWHPLPQPPTTHVQSQELLQLAYTIFVQESQANLADAPQQRLAQNFEYFEPLSGLMDKASYTEKYGPLNLKASFPDLRILTYNYRIDAFRPGVVWFDMRLSGTQNGAAFGDIPAKTGHSYQSPPEAVSLAFNDQKQILRATAGAILDREEGNTGGLGGLHGIRYAMGRPSNPLFTRPFRFHKKDEWKRYSTSTLSPFVDKVHSWKNHQLNPQQQQQQQQHNTPPSHPSQPHQQDQPSSSGDPTGSTTQAGQQQQPGGGGYTHGSQLNVKRPTEGQGPAGSRPGYGGDDVYAHSGNASGYGGTATQSAYGGQGGYGSSFQNPPAYAPHAGTPSQQQPQGHMGGYPSHVTGGTYT